MSCHGSAEGERRAAAGVVSANSPYWQCRDSGLASARIPILSMFPRVGIPPYAAGYREYVAAIEQLTGSGAGSICKKAVLNLETAVWKTMSGFLWRRRSDSKA